MPLPWLKNFSSHGTVPLRGPKGGFIQTNPTQGRCRLLLVMKTFAGTHRCHALSRTGDIHIEAAAECSGYVARRVPIAGRADTLFMQCHGHRVHVRQFPSFQLRG